MGILGKIMEKTYSPQEIEHMKDAPMEEAMAAAMIDPKRTYTKEEMDTKRQQAQEAEWSIGPRIAAEMMAKVEAQKKADSKAHTREEQEPIDDLINTLIRKIINLVEENYYKVIPEIHYKGIFRFLIDILTIKTTTQYTLTIIQEKEIINNMFLTSLMYAIENQNPANFIRLNKLVNKFLSGLQNNETENKDMQGLNYFVTHQDPDKDFNETYFKTIYSYLGYDKIPAADNYFITIFINTINSKKAASASASPQSSPQAGGKYSRKKNKHKSRKHKSRKNKLRKRIIKKSRKNKLRKNKLRKNKTYKK